MKKTTLMVMIVTIIAKIFGFARDKMMTYFFGVGVVSDAFMLTFGVPSMVLTVVAAAFVTGFIPMYTRVKNEDPDEANAFANNIFNIMVAFSLVMGVFMFLFPDVIVKIYAAGFDKATHALASSFVRIVSVSVLFVAIIQLGTGYLNVNQSFILPNVLSIPSNLIIIGVAFVSFRANNTTLLPYGAVAGYAVQGIIMYLYMKRFGFKYKVVFDFKDPHLIRMVTIAAPLLISTLILSLQDLVMMSSSTLIHGKGGYSLIMMSSRLMGFATGLFVTGVLSVAYPTISHAASKNDKVKVIHSMNDAILLISLFIIPASIGFITLSYELVAFVYGGGKVTAKELVVLSNIFKGASLGLFFIAIKDLFTRMHYAYQDALTPLRAQVIHSVIAVILFVALGSTMGISGITLAVSIATLISTIYLFKSLLGKFKRLGMQTIIKDFLKIVISGIAMGLAIFIARPILVTKMSANLSLVVILILAVLVYGSFILILKVQVFYDLFSRKKTA